MSVLSKRIEKLEDKLGHGNAGLFIVLHSNASDKENAAVLRSNDIDPDDPSNLVVAIQRTFIHPDGTEKPANPTPEIASIHDMSKWPRR